MKKKILLISFIVFISLITNASRLKKGYQALGVYNYFEAKQLFEKTKKRHLVASTYGLSIIYQRNDNPFHNIDSAYNNIVLALDNFSDLTEKKKVKYKKIGIDSSKIIRQRDVISKFLFERSIDVNSIYGYQDFIDKNKWSPNFEEAIVLRDSLFFFQMNEKGTSDGYKMFLETYPNSIYTTKATKLYNKTYYSEQTKSKRLISYVEFIKTAPNSPFVPNAENRIFEISTQLKTVKSYESFINDYPINRNINLAWKKLYEANLQNNFSKNEILNFIESHPNYPFKKDAEDELKMEEVDFLSVRIDNKWGFLSGDNQHYIFPMFDYVEPFSEGLALVSINDKVGFISKTGKQKIDLMFDDAFSFQNGFSVVEVNELMGLINRSGEFVVPPKYEDLGNVIEGLCYFESNEAGYGYFDRKGIVRLQPEYTDAANFKDGKAIVSKNNNYGIIDEFGTTSLPFMFQQIKKLNSILYAVKFNDNWGVMTIKKDTIIPIDYDHVGAISSGFIMVTKDFKFNFWNVSIGQFVSERWFDTYTEYKELGLFLHGYAKVKVDEGYNFLDTTGQLLLKKTYHNLGQFETNIAFEKNDEWGYIDKNNKVVLKPMYDKTYSFSQNLGIVILEPLKGIVDENGELLIEVLYEEFTFITDSILIVKFNGKYGVLSILNDTILPIKYKFIEPYSDSVVKIISEREQWYYNVETHKWIRKEE